MLEEKLEGDKGPVEQMEGDSECQGGDTVVEAHTTAATDGGGVQEEQQPAPHATAHPPVPPLPASLPRWLHENGGLSPPLVLAPGSASPASSADSLTDVESSTGSDRVSPEPCPGPQGGISKMRMSPVAHHCLMAMLSLLYVTTGLAYLGWKTFVVATNVRSVGPTAILFLACELLVFFSSLMLILEFMIPARERAVRMLPPSGPFPSVAIFICCCKEPLDIIQDTTKAALNQIYPTHRYTVWVLDDGADAALKAWVEGEAAEQYGSSRVKYLCRPKAKGVPHHFKAGNINYGLQHASGNFIAILDADMIPSRYFLTCLLPHFSSNDIAFVQCPQSFYNLVRGDPLNDSCQDFYDVMLPLRDGRDSAQCVGTGVIMRASCLRENGGFTLGSVTEDFDTALSLHSRGYKTVYMHQRLQAGLAPWTLEGYVKQHQRWCTGSLQILLQRNPLFIRDLRLTFFHRISYFNAGAQYYMNIVVMIMLVLPLLILVLDLPIMPRVGDVGSQERLYILLVVPYIFASRLLCYGLFARLPSAMRVQMRGEQAFYWMSYYNCVAVLRFLFPFLAKTFEATGASRAHEKGILGHLRIVWFHIAFCAAGITAVIWSFVHLNVHDCGQLLKATAWSPYILSTVQAMSVPIWHVLFSSKHPRPEQRKDLILYDEQGIPYFTPDQIRPQSDWRVMLFNVVLLPWVAVSCFLFYAAVADYRPPFCTVTGLFDTQSF